MRARTPWLGAPRSLTSEERHVVLVGVGAVGSHLLPHLARMGDIRRVTLIDPDRYEAHNVTAQAIDESAVGRAKVEVQAERLARIEADVDVVALPYAVERAPLGLLRADVILTCVDGRTPRQWVNACAWRLGVPWIDAGIDAGGHLARVDRYVPAPDAPCLECSWGSEEYASLERRYPCAGGAAAPQRPRTDAPSYLAALAAAVQAFALRRLLDERETPSSGGRVIYDLPSARTWNTTLRRNPECRFDHRLWDIRPSESSPDEITLAECLALADPGAERRLSVEGDLFVVRIQCPGCGCARSVLHLARRLSGASRSCPACGESMLFTGFGVVSSLDSARIDARGFAQRTLQDVGLEPGDVVSVGGRLHLELGGRDG